ncbi:MAG: hypothetical protein M1820_010825 [Bogoriella megaspora]|nr:MAG: hypothetical protein M1820_010825 [Bogoriella megaspora]
MQAIGSVTVQRSLPEALKSSGRTFRRTQLQAFPTKVLQQRRCLLQGTTTARPGSRTKLPIQVRTQRRYKSVLQSSRELLREHPILFPTVVICILIASSSFIYINYVYQNYFIGAYAGYPEPVAAKLRRAIYYTNYSVDVKLALKYYRQALQLAEEHRMDPFSDEILGVKIAVGHLLEKTGRLRQAIEVLEVLRKDCLRWIEMHGDEALRMEEEKVEEGLGEGEKRERVVRNEELRARREKRTRVLKHVVQYSVRLGDLYADAQIWDRDTAEERLVWAVETSLKEKERREKEGVKDGEGNWLSDSEIGASLESLGHEFEAKDNYFLATPLFLQALTLQGQTDCHTVVLMNNVATSLSQQNPRSDQTRPAGSTISPPGPPPDLKAAKETLLANAMAWADRALSVAARITPPQRTEECDMGCAVATHNLGEILEMRGQPQEARKRYEEAKSLSKAVGFDDGVKQATAGLKRLKNAGA